MYIVHSLSHGTQRIDTFFKFIPIKGKPYILVHSLSFMKLFPCTLFIHSTTNSSIFIVKGTRTTKFLAHSYVLNNPKYSCRNKSFCGNAPCYVVVAVDVNAVAARLFRSGSSQSNLNGDIPCYEFIRTRWITLSLLITHINYKIDEITGHAFQIWACYTGANNVFTFHWISSI